MFSAVSEKISNELYTNSNEKKNKKNSFFNLLFCPSASFYKNENDKEVGKKKKIEKDGFYLFG